MNRGLLKLRKNKTQQKSVISPRHTINFRNMQTLPEDKEAHQPEAAAATTSNAVGGAHRRARSWSLLDGRPRGDSTASEATSLFGGRSRENSIESDGGASMFASLRGGAAVGYGASNSIYGAAGISNANTNSSDAASTTFSGFVADSIRSVVSVLPFYQSHRRLMPEVFQSLSDHWIPGQWDDPIPPSAEQTTPRRGRKAKPPRPMMRSWKRRIFLVLTEPNTSISSAIFFGILVITISLMNVVMIIQTIEKFQFTPTDCRTCGGPVSYVFDDDAVIESPQGVTCVCPPAPLRWTVVTLNVLVWFFTVEWCLRVVTFEPPKCERATTAFGFFCQWFNHLTSTSTVLDALAIFPYYIESSNHGNGLMSLRLLRLFRVFQLVRLGSYNETFMSLTAVMFRSVPYLKLLFGVLLFGAAFFGSMMYWLEKGDWKYWEETGDWQFVRLDQYGYEEISPFSSVPEAFWWFFVTATSVGYGDIFPATALGKLVATFAMLMGVLVVAFPVSVFSDLWSQELHKSAWHSLDAIEEEDEGEDTTKRKDEGPISPDSFRSDVEGFGAVTRRSSGVASSANNGVEPSHVKYHGAVDDDHIMLRKEDLAELVGHMRTINDSQKKIRGILSKYRLHPPPTSEST